MVAEKFTMEPASTRDHPTRPGEREEKFHEKKRKNTFEVFSPERSYPARIRRS